MDTWELEPANSDVYDRQRGKGRVEGKTDKGTNRPSPQFQRGQALKEDVRIGLGLWDQLSKCTVVGAGIRSSSSARYTGCEPESLGVSIRG